MEERIWISINKRFWDGINKSQLHNKNTLNEEIDRAIEHWLLINLGEEYLWKRE